MNGTVFNMEQQGAPSGTLFQIFVARVIEGGFGAYASDGWNSDADPNAVFAILPAGQDYCASLNMTRVFQDGDNLCFVQFYGDNGWQIYVAAPTIEGARDYIKGFLKLAPKIEFDDENVIPITFWSLDSHGNPSGVQRKVGSHKWPEIRDNYPMDVRTRLDDLMQVSAPDGSGKMVLWHGPPGTGKTNCVRALAHAWRGWCDVDYIVDPEKLFGEAHYMMATLVHQATADRWRLVVIEDSGEFLRKDAKEQRGQSFGRLLNITDGLVGQGLKLIILVTTNEPFDDLHPAIARPGRCLAHLEFGSFPPEEASKWLGHKVPGEMALAELYEARAEVQTQITKEREEFRPGMYV